MNSKRKQKQPSQTEKKLSFRKTTFRVLDQGELSEAKGGAADMVLGVDMVLGL